MNKKVYGLLLVSAALFSVGTFESCKDTNTDLYNEVLIKETQHYNELKSRIDAIEQSLSAIDTEALQAQVNALKSEVEALKAKLENASTDQLDAIVKRIESLESNLSQKIDNVAIAAVYTPAFGSLNLPFGIKNNLMVGYCGQAKTAIDFNGEIIAGDLVSGNMGTIYLQIDPLNVDFSNTPVKLISSTGKTPGISLSPLKVSDHEIHIGISRANNYLYETTATFASHDEVPHVSLDYKGFKDAAIDIITLNDGVSFTNLAELVYNTVNLDVPSYGVEMEKIGFVKASNYEIGAFAVEPLSLTTFEALANIDPNMISAKISSAANKFVSAIQKALTDAFGSEFISFDVPSINLGLEQDIVVTIPAGTIKLNVGGQIASNTTPVRVTIPKEEFNNMFDSTSEDIEKLLASVQKFITQINNSWSNITDSSSAVVDKAVEQLMNRITPALNRLAVAANPAVFVVDGNKLKRLSTIAADPTILDSNEVEILPTSNTLELAVPFYKKYIKAEGASIIVDGADVNGKVFDGTVLRAAMNVTSSDVVKLTYEVVDYSGKPSAREYYVKVK